MKYQKCLIICRPTMTSWKTAPNPVQLCKTLLPTLEKSIAMDKTATVEEPYNLKSVDIKGQSLSPVEIQRTFKVVVIYQVLNEIRQI